MTRFVRRLQGIGSSVLVSLPKEWVVSNGLEKGSPVDIETGRDSLSVAPTGKSRSVRNLAIAYPLPQDENIAANLTGAYLSGYDIIRIVSRSAIPDGDREEVRNSTRRLVGMEIVEEDPYNITMQFLLDPASLHPEKILARMNAISLGMFGEVLKGMRSGELSGLGTLRNRDAEVNRQYFLLVRLTRGALADRALPRDYNLEGVDALDYRLAANLLENAGDAIVALGSMMCNSDLPRGKLGDVYRAARGLEDLAKKALGALIGHDRRLAIEAISLHGRYQKSLLELRAGITGDIPLSYIDVVYHLERIGKLWSDVADLVGPTYQD